MEQLRDGTSEGWMVCESCVRCCIESVVQICILYESCGCCVVPVLKAHILHEHSDAERVPYWRHASYVTTQLMVCKSCSCVGSMGAV